MEPACYRPAAHRVGAAELARQHRLLKGAPYVTEILEVCPGPALILNLSRQIVAANAAVGKWLGRQANALIGWRFGEALGCIHSADRPEGCGTTPFCAYCGAGQAQSSVERTRRPAVDECRVSTSRAGRQGALDLKVWARPLTVEGEPFLALAVEDVGAEKRRDVMESLFFHDTLNTAGGIQGMLSLLPVLTQDEREEFESRALYLAGVLVEEIESQRDLAEAERGDLVPRLETVPVEDLLVPLRTLYSRHSVGMGKTITLRYEAGSLVRSDPLLLRRVLGNLLKNALEASRLEAEVTVTYRGTPAPTFEVRNEAVMPEAARAQVFQRSFTTKPGRGHGLGTYSVLLLVESYLGGQVSFRSDKTSGTTFHVVLPS